MSKNRSILALALALLLALSTLTACSQPAAPDASAAPGADAAAPAEPGENSAEPSGSGKTRPTSKGKEENSFTTYITDQVTTLDPELFLKQVEDNVIVNVYDPLFFLDNDGNIVNALAESFTENEDGSVDVVLKSGVKFHSGDIFAAEDVAYTLSRCANSAICAPLVGAMEIVVTDDTHITLKFPGAGQGAGFHDLLPYIQGMAIVNKSYCEGVISDPNEDLGFNVDGTSAYKLESINENGDVTLTRFEDFWGEATIDTVNFKYITGSPETAFEAGDLDYAMYTATNFELIKGYDNVITRDQVLNNVGFLVSNCVEGQPTADLRVRQAMAYCLNIEDVASIASSDTATPAYNIATPLVEHYADVADHFDVDVEKANALMTEAGYSANKKLDLSLIVMPAQADWVSACEVMKEMLEQSYFTVNIEQVPDTSRFFTYDFDIGMLSVGLTTQFNSYAMLYNDDTGLNLSGINDETINAAFAAMKDEATTQAAMKTATESLAYIPLFYPTVFFAFDGNLNPGPYYTQFSAFMYRDFSWK